MIHDRLYIALLRPSNERHTTLLDILSVFLKQPMVSRFEKTRLATGILNAQPTSAHFCRLQTHAQAL